MPLYVFVCVYIDLPAEYNATATATASSNADSKAF